jgi:hypothetical protein
MPHELGHRMAVDGEVLPERDSLEDTDAAGSKAEKAGRKDRAMQVRHCACSLAYLIVQTERKLLTSF